MDFNILKVKGFNAFIYLLIGLQLAMLIGIASIFLSVVNDIGFATSISTTVMFLLGLPMLALLYSSATDKTLKTVFFGLMSNIAIISIRGYYLVHPV